MNKFKGFFAVVAIIVAILAMNLAGHLGAQQLSRIWAAGADTWVGADGTSQFTLSPATAAPKVTVAGTAYTGLSTNVSLYGGSTNALRLQVVNGIVTGIVAY